MVTRALPAVAAALLLSPLVVAQWDPPSGQYGKEVATDLRVMTWNVEDALCRTNDKTESGFGNWEACARIVAAMKPDVLLLQEVADNSGNGTGSGVDSVSELTTVLDLFVNGGFDPFEGGAVTAYVRKYDPSLSYPYIFASADTDGFNRNALISRYPFGDLNGDGKATASDMPILLADKYADGFDAGIRGWINAEIDLPDGVYAGDLVIGNSHMKAGGSSSDEDQRIEAAQNIAYFIDHMYNGAGTGTVDPNDKIFEFPTITQLLDEHTVVITGGDLNQDESGGGKGPVAWVAEAAVAGGMSDGTDRDGSDMEYDAATDPFTGNDATIGPMNKLDYLIWQDSIASARREFVFNASTVQGGGGQQPPEFAGALFASGLSSIAADHRPVIVDFVLPLGGGDPGCNTSAVDLGFALPGSSGLTPTFEVCGDLVPGSTADFVLSDAPMNQNAVPVIAFAASPTPFKGGTLVPVPPIVLDPIFTGFAGGVTFPGIDGGLGPLTLVMQWVITDPGLPGGYAFSNALEITWN